MLTPSPPSNPGWGGAGGGGGGGEVVGTKAWHQSWAPRAKEAHQLCQEKMGRCLFKSCLRPATGSVVINYYDYDYFSRALGQDKEGGERQAADRGGWQQEGVPLAEMVTSEPGQWRRGQRGDRPGVWPQWVQLEGEVWGLGRTPSNTSFRGSFGSSPPPHPCFPCPLLVDTGSTQGLISEVLAGREEVSLEHPLGT